MSALSAFLARNSVIASDELPFVHTTRSYNLRAIIGADQISPQECDVFAGENLSYFFVGRPAYKYSTDNSTAESWELPCCLVLESSSISTVKRIVPFDSGAFASRRYPSYINDMPLTEFISDELGDHRKIIGAFFENTEKYFSLNPKSRDQFSSEFSLTALDAELLAANRLASEATPISFDDRRFTIEIQTEESVNLVDSNIMAVILPECYLSIDSVRNKIQDEWGAEPIGYPVFPLSVSMYYALIYKEIKDLYIRRGLI